MVIILALISEVGTICHRALIWPLVTGSDQVAKVELAKSRGNTDQSYLAASGILYCVSNVGVPDPWYMTAGATTDALTSLYVPPKLCART
jgi:hypothetical protein